MFTGGRGVWNRKARVNEARSIDILDLQRKGFFTMSGSNWTARWSRGGKVVASISFRLEAGSNGPMNVRFIYTITDNENGERKKYNYLISVVPTACNYGGMRWWFICPLVVNGKSCQRRCRIVYLAPGSEYFGCRECHQLTYESRQRHREKFYEGFEKPYFVLRNARSQLGRIRSPRKLNKLFQDIRKAEEKIKIF